MIQKEKSGENEAAGKTVSILLFLCRARYLVSLDSGDFNSADLAISDARKALELLPRDEPLKFNLGLLLQARAISIRQSGTTAQIIDSAVESVREAQVIFKELAESSKMDQKLISSRVAMCPALIQGLQERANQTEKVVKEQVDRLEQLKLQREIQAQKETEILKMKEEAEKEKAAEIEKNRRELSQRMKETEEKIKSYKGKVKDSENDRSDDSETDDVVKSSSSSKKKNPRKRVKAIESADNEDAGGSEEEEDEDELDGITSGKTRRRTAASKGSSSVPLLSKEFISSSDDEVMDEKAPLYSNPN